jgi:hypothetical protein
MLLEEVDGLPEGWAPFTDPNTGQTYYWREQTQEATWERPKFLPARAAEEPCADLVALASSHRAADAEVRKNAHASMDVSAPRQEEHHLDQVPRRDLSCVSKIVIGVLFLTAVTLASISWIWRVPYSYAPADLARDSCMPSLGSTDSLPLQPQPPSAQGDSYCTRGYGLMPTQSFPSRFTLGGAEIQITDKLDKATLAECKAECDKFAHCAGFLRGVDTDSAAFNRATWYISHITYALHMIGALLYYYTGSTKSARNRTARRLVT